MIIEELKSISKKPADNHYKLLEPIKQRWSPRIFANKYVTHDELYSLFEAGRWAPSSNNLQPWRFIFARKGGKGWNKMYDCLSDFNQSWVKNAPILVFTLIKENTSKGNKNYHALHDLGLSVGIMSVQAQSMGIALHQMAGVDWEKAQKIFNIPEGYHIVTAIAIGKYGGNLHDLPEDLQDEEVGLRKRKQLTSIVGHAEWSDNLL